MRREHVGAAPATALAAPMSAGANSFTVADGTGYPTGAVGPFFVVVDPETANEEKILCASRTGNDFTVASGGRGADDTSEVSHFVGNTGQVRHVLTALEVDESNEHINSNSNVHGASGDVVGTSDSQTLTNKVISGNDNTLTVLKSQIANFEVHPDEIHPLGYIRRRLAGSMTRFVGAGDTSKLQSWEDQAVEGDITWTHPHGTGTFAIPAGTGGMYLVNFSAMVELTTTDDYNGTVFMQLRGNVDSSANESGDVYRSRAYNLRPFFNTAVLTLDLTTMVRLFSTQVYSFTVTNLTDNSFQVQNTSLHTSWEVVGPLVGLGG